MVLQYECSTVKRRDKDSGGNESSRKWWLKDETKETPGLGRISGRGDIYEGMFDEV